MRSRAAFILVAIAAIVLAPCANEPTPPAAEGVPSAPGSVTGASGPARRSGDPPAAVPHPDLATFEPAVATQIAALRDDVERAAGAGGEGSGGATLARAWGELGRVYHAYELFDSAAACYARAMDLAPGEPRWTYLAAVAAQRRGRLEEAADLLRRVLEDGARARDDDPRSLAALLRLGDVELDAGRFDQARQSFERALAQHEGDAVALYGLGRVAQSRGEWSIARGFFERALQEQPEASIVRYALGQICRELGDEEEARHQLALAGPDPVRFHDQELLGVEALATGAGAHLLAGGRALAIGDHATAIAEHRLAVRADPSSVEAALGLAFSCLRDADRAAEAKSALRAAVRLAPDRAYVRYTVGVNLAALGELDEAEDHLRLALALDPRYLAARFALGRVLAVRGRDREAVDELDAVLELDPRRVEARFARGESLRRLGYSAEALEDLRAALAVDPAHPEVQLWVADALARAGAWDAAIAHYDAVLTLDANLRSAWIKKASALFLAARYADAAVTLERGLARWPDDPLLLTSAARFLASCPDRGLRDGERALLLAQRLFAAEASVEHAELVAMAYAEEGAWSEATRWQRRALDAARAAGESRLGDVLARNLARYEARQTCCAQLAD